MKIYIKCASTIRITDITDDLIDFHFVGTDSDGWKRNTYQAYVKYYGKGWFVELILVKDNVKIAKVRKKMAFQDGDVIITDKDKNDVVIGHYEEI